MLHTHFKCVFPAKGGFLFLISASFSSWVYMPIFCELFPFSTNIMLVHYQNGVHLFLRSYAFSLEMGLKVNDRYCTLDVASSNVNGLRLLVLLRRALGIN